MSNNPYILQVSELTKKVRFIIESELHTVWLSGEISNFISASSGHWYLSLKDKKSQVRCAMFKGNNRRVRIAPKNGQQVLVKAKVSLYEPRGDFQLIIEQMEDAGEGLLRQKFEQLKNTLNAQGLFDLQHKKTLPSKINTVGIITSPTGAAVKDIISVMQRRNPLINIIIYPALVQGDLATAEICQAIAIANHRSECDVLIVGRGGGAIEDLWSFNEEPVVKAIFKSQLPVVSAVGHEIDTTLTDYVADMRAPTPSAAAELVSQDNDEVKYRIKQLQQRITAKISYQIESTTQQLSSLTHRLALMHPEQKLQLQQQRVDDISLRLEQAYWYIHENKKRQIPLLNHKLHTCSPQKIIEQHKITVDNLTQRLKQQIQLQLEQNKNQFVSVIEQLNLVSPLATIARGYSIVRDEKGNIIKNKSSIKVNDILNVQLSDGKITSQVINLN